MEDKKKPEWTADELDTRLTAEVKTQGVLSRIHEEGYYSTAVKVMKEEAGNVKWGEEVCQYDNEGLIYSIEGDIGESVHIAVTYAIEPVVDDRYWCLLYRVHVESKKVIGTETTSSGVYVRQLSPMKTLLMVFTTEEEKGGKKREDGEKPPTEDEFITKSFQEHAAKCLMKAAIASLPKDDKEETWEDPETLVSTTEILRYHLRDDT